MFLRFFNLHVSVLNISDLQHQLAFTVTSKSSLNDSSLILIWTFRMHCILAWSDRRG